MTTIEIVSEERKEETIYRAICGDREATGTTPGQALDKIEQELAARGGEQTCATVVILQRFRPDNLFTAQQQSRLRELMDRFHGAIASGENIAPQEQQYLENLVETEWQAAIERANRILKQIQPDEQ